MKIAIAEHLLHRNHWVVLLSSRERLWLAQTPTRVFISEVTRHSCAGYAYIISWKPPVVNSCTGSKNEGPPARTDCDLECLFPAAGFVKLPRGYDCTSK